MNYYINTEQNSEGDYELHHEYCHHLKSISQQKYIGMFKSDNQALTIAKKKYPSVNGCPHCSSTIYTLKNHLMGFLFY